MAAKIRVVIVDDSSFVRAALARIIESDGRFEVAGQAGDGPSALAMIDRLRPDVVTMDYNMPGMAGDEVVRQLLARAPTPIVMVSAHTTEGAAATVAALAAGAVDVVAKPGGEVSMDLGKVRTELLEKLMVASRARPQAPFAFGSEPPAPKSSLTRLTAVEATPAARRSGSSGGTLPAASVASAPLADRVVIIGSSTGGPAALEHVVRALEGSRIGIVFVQHMTASLTAALATRLDAIGSLRVREAVGGGGELAAREADDAKMVPDAVVGGVDAIAAGEIVEREIELARRQVPVSAPAQEHRMIWRDGKAAGERLDGLPELTRA